MASNMAREYAAQAWRTPQTSNKAMDAELCEAFATILDAYQSKIEALGLAIVDAGYTWTPAMRSAYESRLHWKGS